MLESDSDLEYVPNEESIFIETESSDDQMEIVDSSPTQKGSTKSKKHYKKFNTSVSSVVSTPTSTPVLNRFRKGVENSKSPSLAPIAKSNLAKFQCSNVSQSSDISSFKIESLADSTIKSSQSIQYMHERQIWLQSTQIKDKEGRKSSDPDYNPRSLFVPQKFFADLTPAQKQWWEIKCNNFDTMLCFKVNTISLLVHSGIGFICEEGLIVLFILSSELGLLIFFAGTFVGPEFKFTLSSNSYTFYTSFLRAVALVFTQTYYLS